MSFLKIEETITFKDKEELISIHFYLQLKKHNILISPKDLGLLVELYKAGGYSNKEEQALFFQTCLDKKFKKTVQSVRNTLNKYTEKGILIKPKNSQRVISSDFSPAYSETRLGIIYKMTHQ